MSDWIAFSEAAIIARAQVGFDVGEALSEALRADRVKGRGPDLARSSSVLPGGIDLGGPIAGRPWRVDVLRADLERWIEGFSVARKSVRAKADAKDVADKSSATLPRKRGPIPRKLEEVKAAMRTFDMDDLQTMTEEAMSAEFKASRDTCRRARRELSEFPQE